MRRLQVKVCGMRDPDNIAAVGSLHPDYMGFIFVPSSPRYIGDSLNETSIDIPQTVKRIGVFKDVPLASLTERVAQFKLNGVQLHGDEDHRYIRAAKEALTHTIIIKAIRVEQAEDIANLATYDGSPDIYLLDGKSGGSGVSFDWSWLSTYKASVPFLLAGGIGSSNIDTVLTMARDYPQLLGIDINSKVEVSSGIKDTDQIKRVVARLTI